MDLCERTYTKKRHPWELARIRSLRMILKPITQVEHKLRILDIGCGDGFVVTNLFKESSPESIDAVDNRLSEDEIRSNRVQERNINYYNNYDCLKRDASYNLLMMLDVIEHVKEDEPFLHNIVNTYLQPGGYLLITAPAFNCIFSAHDRYLRHFRRYSMRQLIRLMDSISVVCISSGYLFFPLLPIRVVFLIYERLFSNEGLPKKGVGHWKHCKIPTRAIETLLTATNFISIWLSYMGLKIPGLSLWALCRKRPL